MAVKERQLSGELTGRGLLARTSGGVKWHGQGPGPAYSTCRTCGHIQAIHASLCALCAEHAAGEQGERQAGSQPASQRGQAASLRRQQANPARALLLPCCRGAGCRSRLGNQRGGCSTNWPWPFQAPHQASSSGGRLYYHRLATRAPSGAQQICCRCRCTGRGIRTAPCTCSQHVGQAAPEAVASLPRKSCWPWADRHNVSWRTVRQAPATSSRLSGRPMHFRAFSSPHVWARAWGLDTGTGRSSCR